MPENRKESRIAESFGLKFLQTRTSNNTQAETKARKEINSIGMLIPPADSRELSGQSQPFTWRKIAKRAKHNLSRDTKQTREWQHNGRVVRLGVGTELDRERPHLPRPKSFIFYRAKAKPSNNNVRIMDREKPLAEL